MLNEVKYFDENGKLVDSYSFLNGEVVYGLVGEEVILGNKHYAVNTVAKDYSNNAINCTVTLK